MAFWQNWSGRQQSKPDELCFLRSEEDARQLVIATALRHRTIRVAGAGHSHAPLVTNADVVADMSGLSGVMAVDQANRQAWIRAGSPIYALGAQLHGAGLALKNQGDIDRQLLAGAIATGTHGTGRDLQNMSASVIALRLILAGGDEVVASAEENPDLFAAARLGVGAVGLITRINMQLGESCVLKESSWRLAFDDLHPQLDELVTSNERFEFFWYPDDDQAVVKTINRVDDVPCYPLAEEGARQAWSHEVLPNHRPRPHTEMEYSVPLDHGPACFADIRQLVRTRFIQVKWPVEYRTVAADDIWLSMASGRPTVTLSVHQDIREDEEPYYRACEEIFLAHGGRPHWGKVNYLDAEQFANIYPHWADWWQVRNHHDPDGVFLNRYMRSLG